MSATTLTPPKLHTADDLLGLPKGNRRRELVRGEYHFTMFPGFEHGALATDLSYHLRHFLRGKKLGRLVTEAGFKMEQAPDTVRFPDLAFVVQDRLPEQGRLPVGFLTGAPDLAVEVLSPTNTSAEIKEKLALYFATGACLAWVIQPAKRAVVVHRPDREPQLLQEGDTLDGGDLLPGFTLSLTELFSGD